MLAAVSAQSLALEKLAFESILDLLHVLWLAAEVCGHLAGLQMLQNIPCSIMQLCCGEYNVGHVVH